MTETIVPKKTYYIIFFILLTLTGVTAFVAMVDLGPFNVVVALIIAFFKASLVALFFMHLKYSTHLTWIIAGAGIFWLAILLALTLSDILTRAWA